MTEVRHLSCAETAKLIRKALKKAFAGVKFSVRSDCYAGGASVNIGYVDDGEGPAQKDVEAVVGVFAGGRFDGMIDLAYGVRSWLEPDGSATVAHDPGTAAQRGSHPSHVGAPISEEAELVHFGCDFVFVHRRLGEGYRKQLQDTIAEITGQPYEDNGVYRFGWRGKAFDGWGSQLVHQMSNTPEPEAVDVA